MAKNLVSRSILAQIWVQKIFLWVLPLLNIIHYCKILLYGIYRKTNELNLREKNLVSGLILAPLAQIWAQKNFFCRLYLHQILDIVASYHCMQFQEKLMNQTLENHKKPSFRPNFGHFGPNLGTKNFFVHFTCTRCQTLL